MDEFLGNLGHMYCVSGPSLIFRRIPYLNVQVCVQSSDLQFLQNMNSFLKIDIWNCPG